MLAELHQQLSSLYRVDASHDIHDYLVTDPVLAGVLSQGALSTNTEETLLVTEDDDGVAMSLYLDADMLQRLESDSPLHRLHVAHLDDFWKVLEGISHFNCMAWKARRERSVSLLELELQGEIDKFLSAMLLAEDQDNECLQQELHAWLFEATRLKDDLDHFERKRYEAASRYAARFCHRIQNEWQSAGKLPIDELRRFFRLQLQDKISHIHAGAWTTRKSR